MTQPERAGFSPGPEGERGLIRPLARDWPVRRSIPRVRPAVLALVAVLLICAPAGAVADDGQPTATVLVVQFSASGYLPADRLNASLMRVLHEHSAQRVDVLIEFLDVMVSRGEDYDRAVLEYIRQKYARARIVAVLGVGAQGAQMAIRLRDKVFPDAAVLYAADRTVAQSIDFGQNATGVMSTLDVRGTTALALQLVPATEHVAVVLGASENEREWYDRAVSEIHAAAPGVDVIPLFGLESAEMLRRVSMLPERTVLIWVAYRRDPRGATFTPTDVLAQVRRATSVPVFGVFEYDFGGGIVGGPLLDFDRLGEEAGLLAARIANGERADAIPPVVVTDNPVKVDWREVLKWRIDPRLLPPGSVVYFREPTVWDLYKGYILGGAAVIALQALLIAGLYRQRTRLVRAQRALAERLRFEQLVADLSARYVDLPVERIDAALVDGLDEIRDMYRADFAILVEFGQGAIGATVVHSAVAEGTEPSPHDVRTEDIEDLVEYVRRGKVLQYSRSDEIPPELSGLRAAVERSGIRSGIIVPLHVVGTTLGLLAIAVRGAPRAWSDDAAERLRPLADIFANVFVRKRAEFEAECRRQELAHVSRVSTMGELVAAIAHELNQPLTGMLTNAQAAVRFLANNPPDLEQVNDILRDIIDDDRRAGEVIRRLRSMLQAGAIEPTDVEVNDVVVDVVKLIAGHAAHRNIEIETALAPDMPKIHGDQIQLTQVILNLVVNALDAMRVTEAPERRIAIRTTVVGSSAVTISVADRGPGVSPDMLGRIFQPFFTTKSEGMGMGLSIARTIVEAHGGLLWAENNPDCGALFVCRLPAAAAGEESDGSSPHSKAAGSPAVDAGA